MLENKSRTEICCYDVFIRTLYNPDRNVAGIIKFPERQCTVCEGMNIFCWKNTKVCSNGPYLMCAFSASIFVFYSFDI